MRWRLRTGNIFLSGYCGERVKAWNLLLSMTTRCLAALVLTG